MTKKAQTNMLAAMLSAEPGLQQPARARSHSFASMVASLEVGSNPACRAMQIDPQLKLAELDSTTMSTLRERLRGSTTSAIASAKRRTPGAEFAVEVTDFRAASGFYVIALVTRTA